MKKKVWKIYALWILLAEAVGAAAGLLTRGGMEDYQTQIVKPALSPPALVFPIAWGILYALMGVGAARVSLQPPSRSRRVAIQLFLVQLALNFAWSFIFFGAEAFLAAFLELAVLLIAVVWMTAYFAKLDRPAAWLQLPYLLWLLFAGYLNYGVWLLNR